MDTPLAARDFVAWELPERKASTLAHGWAVGARLGPSANGTLTQWMESPAPGLRKTSLLKVPAVPDAPGQARCFPTINADISFGYSGM